MKRSVVTLALLRIFRTALLVALCFLLLPEVATAQAKNGGGKELAILFEQANIAHTQGDYQQAVAQYLTIIRSNGVSASLLYNLADSYAASGRTGLAVLNYERALRLAPGDSDIQANLEQMRKDAGLYRDDRPFYERLAELLGADQWLLIFAFAFLLLALSALTANLAAGKGRNGILRLLMVSSLVVMILTLPPVLLRYQSWNNGVVLKDDSRLLISPFAEAGSTGGIKAGRLIRPSKMHGEYVLVQDETGKSGWLERGDFQLIAELPRG